MNSPLPRFMMTRAQVAEHIAAAFPATRTPRSVPYKLGAQAALENLALQKSMPTLYAAGSAQYDAFHAGAAEGRQIWASSLLPPAPQPAIPPNAADVLATELQHAETIILAMLRMLSTRQRLELGEEMAVAGVQSEAGGITRYHERRNALQRAGFAPPIRAHESADGPRRAKATPPAPPAPPARRLRDDQHPDAHNTGGAA